MAGDWIKMRGQLLMSPKLIAMTRVLHENRAFRDWLTPGGSGFMNGQVVSDAALRYVTTAALLRVWSCAREFGKFVGNDLVLERIRIVDLDLMADVPGVGEAMRVVGWAVEEEGVILPNFKQHNAPMTNAERQKRYRTRHVEEEELRVTESNAPRVTSALPEKRRVEKSNRKKELPPIPPSLDTPEFCQAWAKWIQFRSERKPKVTPTGAEQTFVELEALGPQRAVKAIYHSIAKGWQGIFEPSSNGRPAQDNGDYHQRLDTMFPEGGTP